LFTAILARKERVMRKRLRLAVALISATALAASAVPAFTADNGSVVATVSIAPPPAPCLTLSTGAVNFGTLPFSDPAAASTPTNSASPGVRVTSCGTADEKIFLAASDATTASGGSWDVASSSSSNTCSHGSNVYEPHYASPLGSGRLYNPRNDGSFATQLTVLSDGTLVDLTFRIQMPCRGSVGAGETASMTFMTLAVVS
jgi:hypothetical protein